LSKTFFEPEKRFPSRSFVEAHKDISVTCQSEKEKANDIATNDGRQANSPPSRTEFDGDAALAKLETNTAADRQPRRDKASEVIDQWSSCSTFALPRGANY
jgi:hypothetical protein